MMKCQAFIALKLQSEKSVAWSINDIYLTIFTSSCSELAKYKFFFWICSLIVHFWKDSRTESWWFVNLKEKWSGNGEDIYQEPLQ